MTQYTGKFSGRVSRWTPRAICIRLRWWVWLRFFWRPASLGDHYD